MNCWIFQFNLLRNFYVEIWRDVYNVGLSVCGFFMLSFVNRITKLASDHDLILSLQKIRITHLSKHSLHEKNKHG